MNSLPSLTAREIVRVIKKCGFVEDRQKGSHLILVHPQTRIRTVVPIHPGKTIKKPLLRAIIEDAGLTVEEFRELL